MDTSDDAPPSYQSVFNTPQDVLDQFRIDDAKHQEACMQCHGEMPEEPMECPLCHRAFYCSEGCMDTHRPEHTRNCAELFDVANPLGVSEGEVFEFAACSPVVKRLWVQNAGPSALKGLPGVVILDVYGNRRAPDTKELLPLQERIKHKGFVTLRDLTQGGFVDRALTKMVMTHDHKCGPVVVANFHVSRKETRAVHYGIVHADPSEVVRYVNALPVQ